LARELVQPYIVGLEPGALLEVGQDGLEQLGIEQALGVGDGALGGGANPEAAAYGGQLEDVFDAAQAVQEGIEEGQQVGNDQLIVEERAIAVGRLAMEVAQVVFDAQDQASAIELVGPPRNGLGKAFRFASHAPQ
jgi:hypothetical protein